MQPNLRYLQDQEPTAVLDEEDDSQGDPFGSDIRDADVAPLRAGPVPAGYVAYAPSVDAGVMSPDDSIVRNGAGAAPSITYPVTRYPRASNGDFGGETADSARTAPQSGQLIAPLRARCTQKGPDDVDIPLPDLAEAPMPIGDLPGPFQNRVIGKDNNLYGAQETRRQIAAEMPVRPQPKVWQRILAGAAGAAAGYSNAAKRAAPIDAAKTVESLLYPGYDQKLASWQSKMAAADQQVQGFGQEISAEQAARKLQSEEQLKGAQSAAAMAHGQYWLNRSAQERNQWKIDPKSGSLYNTITGAVAARPPTAKDRYDTAIALGAKPDEARYYGIYGKPAPIKTGGTTEWQSRLDAAGNDPAAALRAKQQDEINKARESRDPSIAGMRVDQENLRRNQDTDQVQKTRNDAERRILSDMQAKITGLTTSGQTADKAAREASIRRDAATQLQSMNQEYVDAIRRRGGTAQDYDVDPVTLQWKPRVVAPAAATPQSAATHAAAPATPAPATVAPSTTQPVNSPIRVTLPGGKTKVFPDQKSLDAFAAAAGLTFTPVK